MKFLKDLLNCLVVFFIAIAVILFCLSVPLAGLFVLAMISQFVLEGFFIHMEVLHLMSCWFLVFVFSGILTSIVHGKKS